MWLFAMKYRNTETMDHFWKKMTSFGCHCSISFQVWVIEVDSGYNVEQSRHFQCTPFRVNGEWFFFPNGSEHFDMFPAKYPGAKLFSSEDLINYKRVYKCTIEDPTTNDGKGYLYALKIALTAPQEIAMVKVDEQYNVSMHDVLTLIKIGCTLEENPPTQRLSQYHWVIAFGKLEVLTIRTPNAYSKEQIALRRHCTDNYQGEWIFSEGRYLNTMLCEELEQAKVSGLIVKLDTHCGAQNRVHYSGSDIIWWLWMGMIASSTIEMIVNADHMRLWNEHYLSEQFKAGLRIEGVSKDGCRFEGGCTSLAIPGYNFCINHGGGKRCQFEGGCSTGATLGYKFCTKHGGCEVASLKEDVLLERYLDINFALIMRGLERVPVQRRMHIYCTSWRLL